MSRSRKNVSNIIDGMKELNKKQIFTIIICAIH